MACRNLGAADNLRVRYDRRSILGHDRESEQRAATWLAQSCVLASVVDR